MTSAEIAFFLLICFQVLIGIWLEKAPIDAIVTLAASGGGQPFGWCWLADYPQVDSMAVEINLTGRA